MGRGINIYNLDCLVGMKDLGDESVDLITTDPPYGISFMGKDWDKFNEIVDPQGAYAKKKGFKKLPRQNTASMAEFFVPIWTECLRVLKAGAFAFVMCSPRADVMAKQINALQEAGFQVNFTPIYWAYASGFPKAQNIGKAVDKRLGISEVEYREPFGRENRSKVPTGSAFESPKQSNPLGDGRIGYHKAISPQAKALDGSYGGFQPKPAVEVIIVAMKPLSEKTFVDQALKNRKGITWLDDCRVPYESEYDKSQATPQGRCTGQVYDSMLGRERKEFDRPEQKGRFPANLLVSDDVLNDGRITKTRPHGGDGKPLDTRGMGWGFKRLPYYGSDSGSFSRYFDLDKWAQKTFPFLIVPKASKSEKNKGLGNIEPTQTNDGRNKLPDNAFQRGKTYRNNPHPTVKPVKLFSYLVTLGSRAGDVVLDPFGGTMTTAMACAMLGREFIGYEIDAGSYEISQGRVKAGWQIKLEALGGKG